MTLQRTPATGIVLLAMLASLATGCRSGPALYAVVGEVTFNGAPVEAGDVLLLDPAKVHAPAHGKIVKGQFRLQSQAGVKRVEIRAARDSGKKTEMGPIFEDYIPEKFNTQSTLTAEVVPGGKNHFTFNLTTGR